MLNKNRCFLICCIWLCSSSCSGLKVASANTKNGISGLVFLSEKDIPYNQQFRGTTIGGLSGIDYNAGSDSYYLISDDRSAINPARFYKARVVISNNKIDTVIFLSVDSLKAGNGGTYPNSKQDPPHTPDPEGIRFNPKTNTLVWTSEGERIVNENTTVLANPSITTIDTNGQLLDTFLLPNQLRMTRDESGPRQNGVLEGLTFADDFKTLFVNVEEPLYQDGPRAAVQPNNAWIRIVKFNTGNRMPIAQYAYHLDAVAYPSKPANAFQLNGIPDILSIANNKLLVVERSFSTGRLACTIKVFLAELSGAEDISDNSSLIANPPVKPVKKTLLLNMDTLGRYTDNIEGVTFGPVLPNGHKTLVFVADNNFSIVEKT
ncbi:MAG: esterase-like activity of phytase family protein, partial [Chitinophagaceae bacterium]|nr:esterase-like activity of phytase family protein [Chitinophagaceae bacterium]